MSKKKKRKKVVRYRKPMNIGIIFFGAIFFYMLIYIYMYFTSVHISGYEVIAGSLATDKQFSGLILRDEEVFYANTAGYVDYYASESSKVSKSTLVYTVDESGKMSEYLQENSEEVNLSADNYASLKNDISAFSSAYDATDFGEVYSFHSSTNGTVLELLNQSMLENMEEISSVESNAFDRVFAEKSGIVEYYIDGLEDVTPDTVTPEMFDKSSYKKENLRSVDLISPEDPVYKLVTSESWSMVVPVNEDQLNEIAYKSSVDDDGNETTEQRTVIDIKFLKDNTTAWANLSILNMNGAQYLRLDFNNSMVRFAADRFEDIQFLIDDTSGLKIPTSAITTKEFFVIPEAYIQPGDDENKEGFLVESFDADGTATQTRVSPTFYAIIDGNVYVDPNEGSFATSQVYIKSGDRIIQSDSNERYQVGATDTLEGVYCINQGFTQFRKIKVLYSNEEYSIIEEGTSYGLSIYDRIVLNSEAVKEDQVIY